MSTRAIDTTTLEAGFRGRVVKPFDRDYDDVRAIWNGEIDRRPALFARCVTATDVRKAVLFARETGLTIAVRGGGHGVGGQSLCDDGIVIDLSPMRGVWVDPAARTARVQGGALWGDVDASTQSSGLAVTGGIVTHTGVAGLTLGGGIGWLMRKHGLTVDNLLSADMVTADGTFVHADPTQTPELFWGLRGGGGNFGIVTSFEFRLHPVGPEVLAGALFYELADAPAVLRNYARFIDDVPDELTTIVNLRRAPALPILPESLHGKPIVAIAMTWCGDIEEGERVIRPLREFKTPAVDLVMPKPYLTQQAMFDPTVPHGWHYYWKSHELGPLNDAMIDTIVAHAEQITSPLTSFPIFQLGGAVSRVGEDDTAYSNRGAAHNININAIWMRGDPDRERHIGWARDFWDAMQPYAQGVYVNFMGEEGEERVRQAYGAAKHDRLVALKDTYDPENVFRLNQNIAPSRAPAATGS